MVPKFNDKCSSERRAQVGGSSRMMRTPSERAEAGGHQKLPDILEEGSTWPRNGTLAKSSKAVGPAAGPGERQPHGQGWKQCAERGHAKQKA